MRVTAADFRTLVAPPEAADQPADEEPRRPRRGDGGECGRCHKLLMHATADGLGPVCRRIIAAERAAAEQTAEGDAE